LTENGDLNIALDAVDSTMEIVKNKEKKNIDKYEEKPVLTRQQRNEYRIFKAELLLLLNKNEELLKFLNQYKRYESCKVAKLLIN
jgi:hypothetical protein